MKAQVNGQAREITDRTSVQDLLAESGFDRPGVAVAMNGVVVPRARWASTWVPDGAELDVLTAVHGG